MDRNFIKFKQFHKDNPEVYQHVKTATRELVNQGFEQIGTMLLFEMVRYHPKFRTGTNEKWKLNNTYKPFYARMLTHEYPELKGMIKTRGSEADRVDWNRFFWEDFRR